MVPLPSETACEHKRAGLRDSQNSLIIPTVWLCEGLGSNAKKGLNVIPSTVIPSRQISYSDVKFTKLSSSNWIPHGNLSDTDIHKCVHGNQHTDHQNP